MSTAYLRNNPLVKLAIGNGVPFLAAVAIYYFPTAGAWAAETSLSNAYFIGAGVGVMLGVLLINGVNLASEGLGEMLENHRTEAHHE
jgi:hypothetical protein